MLRAFGQRGAADYGPPEVAPQRSRRADLSVYLSISLAGVGAPLL